MLTEQVNVDENLGIVLDGRALLIVPAVDRAQAVQLGKPAEDLVTDKRSLFLINEGLIMPKTSFASKFWPAALVQLRERQVRTTMKELKRNANSFISTTRLSIRHLPSTVEETELKRIVLEISRLALSKADKVFSESESAIRQTAEKQTPRLKQVKIVRSTTDDRMGKSKGYAFIEFSTHPHALLFVRYVTNHDPQAWSRLLPDKIVNAKGKAGLVPAPIIEFAVEKSHVVNLRNERVARQKQQVEAIKNVD